MDATQSQTRSARFAGCLVGGAVGDALGAPVEFYRIEEIRRRYGPAGIVQFAEVYGREGAITDDTQMTLFTAEGLLRAAASRAAGRRYDPTRALFHAYLRWLHTQARTSANPSYDDALDGWLIRIPALHSQRSPGNTCVSSLMLPDPGTTTHPINDSKGCGGVMRVAPIGLWEGDVFDLACRACALTHGHPTGWIAGGVFAAILHHILEGESIARAVHRVRKERRHQMNDEVATALDRAVGAAKNAPEPTPEILESLGGGWTAEEALAIGVYCALVARDFTSGVVAAVNHSGDSDSTGSIAGNLLGAAFGIHAIPYAYLQGLELREELELVAEDLCQASQGGVPPSDRYPLEPYV